MSGHPSPSGVWIADDFRSNLIIDRYDPVFADLRVSKLTHLRSVNSKDAVNMECVQLLASEVLTDEAALGGDGASAVEMGASH